MQYTPFRTPQLPALIPDVYIQQFRKEEVLSFQRFAPSTSTISSCCVYKDTVCGRKTCFLIEQIPQIFASCSGVYEAARDLVRIWQRDKM